MNPDKPMPKTMIAREPWGFWILDDTGEVVDVFNVWQVAPGHHHLIGDPTRRAIRVEPWDYPDMKSTR